MRYPFEFVGGSETVSFNSANAVVKFHAYICDPVKQEEHHLYQAMKTGIVEKSKRLVGGNCWVDVYQSVHPVVKIFTSARGFGLPQEYFSYFFLLDGENEKLVRIKPLQFNKFPVLKKYSFLASGRFLTEPEIVKLYGPKSKTVLFFKRQSYISASRIKQMVTLESVDSDRKPVATREEVRMLRI